MAVPLTELAQHAGVSPFWLSRRFHAQLGLPPSVYQRQLRVDRARAYLRRGWPLADVATACGFYDQAHLHRHFRRMTGVTPGGYARPAPIAAGRTSTGVIDCQRR